MLAYHPQRHPSTSSTLQQQLPLTHPSAHPLSCSLSLIRATPAPNFDCHTTGDFRRATTPSISAEAEQGAYAPLPASLPTTRGNLDIENCYNIYQTSAMAVMPASGVPISPGQTMRGQRRAPPNLNLTREKSGSLYVHHRAARSEPWPPGYSGPIFRSLQPEKSAMLVRDPQSSRRTPTEGPSTGQDFHNVSPRIFRSSSISTQPELSPLYLEDSSVGEDELAEPSGSGRRPIPSHEGSLMIPRTVCTDKFEDDENFKFHPNGEANIGDPASRSGKDVYLHVDELDYPLKFPTIPKLDRTISDVCQDELYNPLPRVPSKSCTQNSALLSPYRNSVCERLQAANEARSRSSSHSASSALSPFRAGSPFAPNSQGSPMLSALADAEGKESAATAPVVASKAEELDELKTISPKDAFLQYHVTSEDSAPPMFGALPTDGACNVDSQEPLIKSEQDPDVMDVEDQHSTWQLPPSSEAETEAAQSMYSFSTSSVCSVEFVEPSTSPAGTSSVPEFSPESRPRLTSVDSSNSYTSSSDEGSENGRGRIITKPVSTLADTGTYTCTYHGCSLRFESPQKLQKHKREGHRTGNTQLAASTPAVSGTTLGTQAGPHRCTRTNPSTGRPCDTMFSRPYDLTRHEDTIHNVRKQKVKCELCKEGKTFSRSDALTRHMRIVHPQVEFPGKHRRRIHDS